MDVEPRPMSRRDFLKLAGTVAGTGLLGALTGSLAGCSVLDKLQSEPIISPTPSLEQIAYLKEHGENPQEMIIEKLESDIKLVGLGEIHRQLDMELFANSVIAEAAKRELINFLALEIDTSKQIEVNVYLQTGIVTKEFEEVFRDEGYKRIFETARQYKLSILCVDKNDSDERGNFMKGSILNYMRQNFNQKGIFYAGNWHIAKGQDLLTQELKDRYYSVIQINSDTENIVYKAVIQAGITQPVGIDMVSKTPFSKIPHGYPYEL